MTNEQPPQPDSPPGWHWGIGERGSHYYDRWLYTNAILYRDGEFGWECHIYWDDPGEHIVEFIQYVSWLPDGDPLRGYPEHQRSFETESEANEYAVEKAAELRSPE